MNLAESGTQATTESEPFDRPFRRRVSNAVEYRYGTQSRSSDSLFDNRESPLIAYLTRR